MQNPDETLARLLAKADRQPGDDGCWLWTAFCSNGYGRLKVDGQSLRAHRVAYELLVGPIPEGAMILHSCNVRCCVNPEHLKTGTHEHNMEDLQESGEVKGVGNGQAKLSVGDVLAIRYRHGLGETGVSLADAFSVSRSVISTIVNNKSWSHI